MIMSPSVTLRSLEAVIAVDRERHFGRAALALGISQPSLSQLVKRVEEELGGALFDRRPVRPTPAGRQFLGHLRASLDSLDAAVESARATLAGRTGTLRVGFTASAVLSPMPTVIAAFRTACPEVEIVLRESSTADQLDRVTEGALDVGFVRQYPVRPDLERVRILREPFVAVVPAAHPLAERELVPLAALAGESFVHFPREEAPGLYDDLLEMCSVAGFEPRVVQTATHWTTVVALVEAGIGVSLVPRSLTRLHWRGVRFLTIESGDRSAEVFAVFPARRVSGPSARFRELLERR